VTVACPNKLARNDLIQAQPLTETVLHESIDRVTWQVFYTITRLLQSQLSSNQVL